ncbi:aryl-alcohol-oxidase from pleurotus Eryingii [Heliocybe sulcata]|uniref:Aryl-alcohol-oxidase from pleurotus Eryingii n=1 Tax=Heliocybe sulcata TaxID=5364 RepID=A0A5C3NDM1_9AGAM|nr:aryl-alcohol-oxidase from pleurotus Eryingii [Heliocybe sulcata]
MPSFISSSLFVSLYLITFASAATYTDPSQLPSKSYDYIIVGAGTAGNVIANRLTENPQSQVLVIEAGAARDGNPYLDMPLLAPELSPNTSYTWNYTTVPQPGLNSREIPYPRGRLVGGTSSINWLFWTRGSSDDFNRYASVTGDPGWSWLGLMPYMYKNEKLTPPADGHDTTGQINPALHGKNGPLDISVYGYARELDDKVMQTTKELSSEFPYNSDTNSGNPLGVGYLQSSIGGGTRSSSASAYLEPVLTRTNLDVLLQTTVTKVYQTGNNGDTPIFRGVQFAQSSSGPSYALNATKEVILSAGSINTPQILMLSGIGDANALQSLGIKPVLDLPDVGRNLSDHPLLSNIFAVNSNNTFDVIFEDSTVANADAAQWAENKTGLFVDALANQLGWFRLPKTSPIFQQAEDPTAGSKSPHYEIIIIDGWASIADPHPGTGHWMTLVTNLISPTSRGSVTLASTDPFASPVIDPGLLNSDFDIYTMKEAIKAAQRFSNGSAFNGFVESPFPPLANATDDASLEQYAREHTTTVWHPTGTTAMSACDADYGVVDPDLNVKGTMGLRIVDAGIFPYIPGAHPQAPLYMMAERAADLIKAGTQSCYWYDRLFWWLPHW